MGKIAVLVCKECGRSWEFTPTRSYCPRCDKKLTVEHWDGFTTCSNCGHSFDGVSIPEVMMGYVECPKCGYAVDQEGNAYACSEPVLREMPRNQS